MGEQLELKMEWIPVEEALTIEQVIDKVNVFRYRLNPEELHAFDLARDELRIETWMSHRNQQFVRWMLEKYGQRPHETTCNPRQK